MAHPDSRSATGTGGPGERAAGPRQALHGVCKNGMLGRDTDTPEPEVVVLVLGLVVVPVRGAQVLGRIVERAATNHPPPGITRLLEAQYGTSRRQRQGCGPGPWSVRLLACVTLGVVRTLVPRGRRDACASRQAGVQCRRPGARRIAPGGRRGRSSPPPGAAAGAGG